MDARAHRARASVTGRPMEQVGPRSVAGFTLIELVLTLLLVSVLAVAAVASWPGPAINLHAEAGRLADDIRYAQSLAMTRTPRYRINFASDRYWLSTRDGATVVAHPVAGSAAVPLSSGVNLSTPLSFLVFDDAGIPYVDAALPGTPLATDAVLTLAANGSTRTVRISPETGRVIVQ